MVNKFSPTIAFAKDGLPLTYTLNYGVTDEKGAWETSTIDINLTKVLSSSSQPLDPALLISGLRGEYFGYNDTLQDGGNNWYQHKDDKTLENIDSLSDLYYH